MMNLNLLCNPSIEKIVTAASLDSLESLAICSCYDNFAGIGGIGPKKAEEIKKILEQHGLRTKLSNEEYFLVNIFANNAEIKKVLEKQGLRTKLPNDEYFLFNVFDNDNRFEMIVHFWNNPMSDEQKNCLYDLLLSGLFERENAVLKLHYGLGCERISLEEIGQKYNSTRERIRQILVKAERKLRYTDKKQQLELLIVSRSELQSRLLATEEELSIAKKTLEYYEHEYGKTKPADGPIEVLNLSIRTYNSLKRAGINTIEEARNTDLTKLRNFGPHSIEEVTEKISNL